MFVVSLLQIHTRNTHTNTYEIKSSQVCGAYEDYFAWMREKRSVFDDPRK